MEACVTDTLFDVGLKRGVFLCVVEIISNSKKEKIEILFLIINSSKNFKIQKITEFFKEWKNFIEKAKKKIH